MSRIGKKPIPLPAKVQVDVDPRARADSLSFAAPKTRESQ